MSFEALPPYGRNITKVTVIEKKGVLEMAHEIRKTSKCRYRKAFWAIKVLWSSENLPRTNIYQELGLDIL